MPADKIGVGIIGANLGYGWGGRSHLPALAALSEYELAAVCTAHPETAEATATQYGARHAYSDFHQMLQDPAVQVVDVCVRVPRHYELVKAAIEAGKHVYCEWPLGRTTVEAEELAALARARGVQTMVGAQARGAPSVRRLRELIADGYLGRVVSATLTQFLPGVLRPRPTSAAWSADRSAGVGTLSIATGHALDLVCWCLGDFRELSARVSTQVAAWPLTDSPEPAPVTAPDDVALTGLLANGAVAAVHIASIPWHGSAFRLEIYGTEGTLVATSDQMVQFVDLQLRGGRHDETALADLPIPERLRQVSPEVPDGTPLNVAQMFATFAEGIRSGQDVSPSFAEAAQRQRLLDSIQRSSDTRTWVEVERALATAGG